MTNSSRHIRSLSTQRAVVLLLEVVFACAVATLCFSQAVAQTSVSEKGMAGTVASSAAQSDETSAQPKERPQMTLRHKTEKSSRGKSLTYAVSDSLMPDYGKVILAMILVIGGIYGVVTALKRMMGRRAGAGGRGDAIEFIEALHLSPKKQITLVRVGRRGALLAVTENGIQTLLELDSEETGEALELARSKEGAMNFKESLGRARKKMTDLRVFARKTANLSPQSALNKRVSESAQA